MAKLLETDVLENQTIVAALEIGSYTASAEKFIGIDIMADQIQGDGDYEVYITRQLAGAGSAYKSMVTTETVVAGVTAILFPSIIIRVSNTDILKVYLKGLGADTTTVDTRVEFWDAPVVVADILSDATAFAGANIDQQLTTLLTTAMTESYASDGSAPTLAQAQFATQQFLQERSISNLTLTVKKLDGTTTAQTFTLNDAATPSSITRAS